MHIKLAVKCIQTSRKEKFDKQPVVIFFKNNCSVQYVFLYLQPNFWKSTFEVVHITIGLSKENSHSHGKFTERLFLLEFLCIKFFEQVLLRTTCNWWKKNQQNLSTKIKTWWWIVGARTCLLKIMSLRAIILFKTDFAIFSLTVCHCH